MSNNVDIILIGAGQNAECYAKVLAFLKLPAIVVTRGEDKANKFKKVHTSFEVVHGGIEKYAASYNIPANAIVSTNIDSLYEITVLLIQSGVKNILVEKPVALYADRIKDLVNLSIKEDCNIFVALNRRSYSSIRYVKENIIKDGGALSCHFNFTEAISKLKIDSYSESTLNFWGLSNSIHLIDSVFYLIGTPKELNTNIFQPTLNWHKSGTIFNGNGVSESGTIFSYDANWDAPGRWGIQIMTKKKKYILSPLESVQEQNLESFNVFEVKIKDDIDKSFKPGFFLQTKNFHGKNYSELCSIEEYYDIFKNTTLIFDYKV